MIKKYKITYHKYTDLKNYIPEIFLYMGILDVILLIILLINKNFKRKTIHKHKFII